MQRGWPYRACALVGRTRFKRHAQTLPRWEERRVVWTSGHLWWLMEWRARRGWWCLSRGRFVRGEPETVNEYPRPEEWEMGMKRRDKMSDVVVPILGSETKLLAKLPRLVEFLSSTVYEDGTFRQPGQIRIGSRFTTYEVTLYDPDAGLRLSLRAVSIDEALILAEKAVDAEGMPWEVDNYLQSMLAKKKKLKR